MKHTELKTKQSMLSYSITITIISSIISGLIGFLIALMIVSANIVECINNKTCTFIDPNAVTDFLQAINLSTVLSGSLALLYAVFISLIVYNSAKQDKLEAETSSDAEVKKP